MTVDAQELAIPLSPAVEGEKELVRQIQAGDLSAFRRFYDQFAPLVYNYIRLRVPTDEDAEDIAAEVFAKAYQALPKYKWKGVPIAAWLLRSAHNQIVDVYRKRSRFSWEQWLPWKAAQVDSKYRQVEQQDVIQRALDALSYEQQVIIYLSFFEGYSNKEIASFLGKSANTIGVAKHRALQRMGEEIENVKSA